MVIHGENIVLTRRCGCARFFPAIYKYGSVYADLIEYRVLEIPAFFFFVVRHFHYIFVCRRRPAAPSVD